MSMTALTVLFISALVPSAMAGEGQPCCDCEYRATDPWYNGQCGISKVADAGDIPLASRIVGGQDADPNEYPWQIWLMNPAGGFCGGSILNRYWILTAAHCVDCGSDTGVQVVAGDHNITEFQGPPEQSRNSMRVVCCDTYDDDTLADDIALIKVTEPFVFDQDVTAICPPSGALLSGGETVVLTGWGDTDNVGTEPAILQETTAKALDQQSCSEDSGITGCHLCSTDGVSDAERSVCYGDSGGPVAVKDSTPIFRQVGINSFVYGGCATGSPFVSTRVACYLRWIDAVMPEEDRTV